MTEPALPPLRKDRAFLGMAATQFLGAFNDNLFKQLLLLVCLDEVRRGGTDLQPVALALFAIPFVLFSGFAGQLSDRVSKRSVVVACKLGEIVVMALGMAAFLSGQVYILFVVLFLMSTQSAFFGPSKYGVLPEMLREEDLPQANGLIQTTTFLAILLGAALAGSSKERLGDRLWIVSACCVVVAVAGTCTSLLLRPTPVARPGLPFRWSSVIIHADTRRLLGRDRLLLVVLAVNSLFWFIGGLVQPSINAFGKVQLDIGDERASLLLVWIGIGIAVGCSLAGKLSHRRVDFRLVRRGALAMALLMFGQTALGLSDLDIRVIEWGSRLILLGMGIAAGFFVVPLSVSLQSRPPDEQKGRMIGAMNLCNWIGILLAAGFYRVCQAAFTHWELKICWIFAAAAVFILPVTILRFPEEGRRVPD